MVCPECPVPIQLDDHLVHKCTSIRVQCCVSVSIIIVLLGVHCVFFCFECLILRFTKLIWLTRLFKFYLVSRHSKHFFGLSNYNIIVWKFVEDSSLQPNHKVEVKIMVYYSRWIFKKAEWRVESLTFLTTVICNV